MQELSSANSPGAFIDNSSVGQNLTNFNKKNTVAAFSWCHFLLFILLQKSTVQYNLFLDVF